MTSSNRQVPLPGRHRPQSLALPDPAAVRREVAELLAGPDEDTDSLSGLATQAWMLEQAHEVLVAALNTMDTT